MIRNDWRIPLAACALMIALAPAALAQSAGAAPPPAGQAAPALAPPPAPPVQAPHPPPPPPPGGAPLVMPRLPGAASSASGAGAAPVPVPGSPAVNSLDGRIQDAKSEVIELNRDLLVLEEELLFPANTQVAVFVSMDVGKLFALDSVQLQLDGTEVAAYLYTPQEVQALHRGGMQRLYVGNLRSGKHELIAYFTGQGPHTRDYRRGTTLTFEKGTDPKYIELQIRDQTGYLQPDFSVKVWQ